jgi:hypothetical protein
MKPYTRHSYVCPDIRYMIGRALPPLPLANPRSMCYPTARRAKARWAIVLPGRIYDPHRLDFTAVHQVLMPVSTAPGYNPPFAGALAVLVQVGFANVVGEDVASAYLALLDGNRIVSSGTQPVTRPMATYGRTTANSPSSASRERCPWTFMVRSTIARLPPRDRSRRRP